MPSDAHFQAWIEPPLAIKASNSATDRKAFGQRSSYESPNAETSAEDPWRNESIASCHRRKTWVGKVVTF
jgi:hypothetical protein